MLIYEDQNFIDSLANLNNAIANLLDDIDETTSYDQRLEYFEKLGKCVPYKIESIPE